ncbi:MAG: 2,3-bisphosphoglycerate-independent phosphoglycerate mutase [Candidatus Gracilibacteria bacterium]|jgi:2,3-bisphosphoglycerate-independent phosphoglycerate mutase|nr:2,3-bisphosphoglycerate-independent phosphoglycerate mutase [Candidatus Gracilibacteria bacterium]
MLFKKITQNKVLLIVLDGIGEGKNYKYNAVTKAKTPFINSLKKTYPTTLLNTHGNFVGLPKNTMGGSEVGHYTMGVGRIVYQSLEEINRALKSKKAFEKPLFKKEMNYCLKKGKRLHLIGMISDAGVHSHINHMIEVMKYAKKIGIQKIYIHAITDGRDTEEKCASRYIEMLNKTKIGKIATIIGRFYAMDRDTNYTRTKKAYDLITKGKGKKETDAKTAIENEYKRGTKTDYYIKPILLDKEGLIDKDDLIIFTNFRSDRASQLTKALTEKSFKEFDKAVNEYRHFIAFGPYAKKEKVLFPPASVKNNLSETLSKAKKSQLKIAETEKYAHVTFFFNSQNKIPFKKEDQVLVPSPKVSSYDQKPEMSAPEITKELLKNLEEKSYDFILLNFANGDLVGHSGNFDATKKAVEILDECLSQIIPKALEKNYHILITADHGNAEYMKYENGENCASHTLNPVFLILVSKEKQKLIQGKKLGLFNIAPTVLDIMNIKKPKEMTEKSLLTKP